MSSWSGLDFFIFLIFLVNTLLGMARGATKEIISSICLCAALVITLKFTIPLTKFVNSSPLITDVITSQFVQNFMRAIEMPPLTESMLLHLGYCVSLAVCFVGTFSVCEGVLAYASAVEVFTFPYATLNRKIGGGLGAVRGFVIVLVFIIILEHLYIGDLPSSKFINLLQGSANKMDTLITEQAPERYQEILQDRNLYNQKMILKDLMGTSGTGIIQ
ncbi:MAG TPA: CvpA family protein [Gammaproteobacteria bacterium]|nr:CvpA family protein [Gammaproteobacteria bacterium]